MHALLQWGIKLHESGKVLWVAYGKQIQAPSSKCIYLVEKLGMQEMAKGDPWTYGIIVEGLYLALYKDYKKMMELDNLTEEGTIPV